MGSTRKAFIEWYLKVYQEEASMRSCRDAAKMNRNNWQLGIAKTKEKTQNRFYQLCFAPKKITYKRSCKRSISSTVWGRDLFSVSGNIPAEIPASKEAIPYNIIGKLIDIRAFGRDEDERFPIKRSNSLDGR